MKLKKQKKIILKKKIGFQYFNNNIDGLSKFEFVNKESMSKIKEEINGIEDIRSSYKDALNFYNNKQYNEAINCITGIESKDENTNKKLLLLKEELINVYKPEVDENLDELIKKQKYNEALEQLNLFKLLYTDSEYNNKKNELDSLISKGEEKNKFLKDQKKKREEAAIAAYLVGYVPNPEMENIVSAQASATKFLVVVDTDKQETNIFVGKQGDWKLIKRFICSTGVEGKKTPKGHFKISDRGNWFYS